MHLVYQEKGPLDTNGDFLIQSFPPELILIQLLPVITVEDLRHVCLQLLSNPKLKQSR